MDERRCLERLKPYYYLRVYDEKTDDYVGSVVDITIRGMRLLAEYPFEAKSRYHFAMRLPPEGFFGDTVRIGAYCRWSRRSRDESAFEGGFEFSGNVDEGIHTLRALVRDLQGRKQM
jgi:hypothetical protein